MNRGTVSVRADELAHPVAPAAGILGRGGAGKSVLAHRVAAANDAPVVELDSLFWTGPDLRPLGRAEWTEVQRAALSARSRWIADGDLGPYDDLGGRLPAADTVVMLDYSLARCVWQALRRGRERSDFWLWVLSYRRRWRPVVFAAVRNLAPTAEMLVLRNPRATARWLELTQPG
ncbi:MAG: hypothetical protein ACRDRK_24460 [Pseudonocardia sp.]